MGLKDCCSCRNVGAVVSGALLGAALSFVVNCTLVEISLNPFFSFYFGILFMVVGTAIVYRINSHTQIARKAMLFAFATLVLLAGGLCLFFQPDWIFTLSSPLRCLLYGVIGLATCFAITFSTVDVINYCCDQCKSGPVLIESQQQVHLVLAVSIFMGIGYGIFFAALEVGKTATDTAELQSQLGREEVFCVPFGLVVGGAGAAYNEYLRNKQMNANEYKQVNIGNSVLLTNNMYVYT